MTFDWGDLYGVGQMGGGHAPGDPIPPRIGERKTENGLKYCYLSKKDGTCTVTEWKEIMYSSWDMKDYVVIRNAEGDAVDCDKSYVVPPEVTVTVVEVDLSKVYKPSDLVIQSIGRTIFQKKTRSTP